MKKKLIIILLPLVLLPLVCSVTPKSQDAINNPGIAFVYPVAGIVTDGDIMLIHRKIKKILKLISRLAIICQSNPFILLWLLQMIPT